jgi:hypothetical protein
MRSNALLGILALAFVNNIQIYPVSRTCRFCCLCNSIVFRPCDPAAFPWQAWVTETSEHGYPGQLESIARAAALKAVRPSFIQSQPLQRQAVVASSIPEFVGKICTPQASSKERKRNLQCPGELGFGKSCLGDLGGPQANEEQIEARNIRNT